MCTPRFAVWIAWAAFLAVPSTGLAEDAAVGMGTPVEESELRPWSITVFPDGRGLPPGRGSVAEGAELYPGRCGYCHGKTGTEGPASRLAGSDGFLSLRDPLRVVRIQKNPLLVLSVGAQWPHATSIFDYVRRAMPPTAPKSLSNDEAYALTAYILHLNDLLGEQDAVDGESLPRIEMPGLARSVDARESER